MFKAIINLQIEKKIILLVNLTKIQSTLPHLKSSMLPGLTNSIGRGSHLMALGLLA